MGCGPRSPLHYKPYFPYEENKSAIPNIIHQGFFDSLDAADVRDRVCNVMESNCTNTLQFNNLTVDGCKEAYDKLNMTDNGYLDGNTKACRMLHSGIVPQNTVHCLIYPLLHN